MITLTVAQLFAVRDVLKKVVTLPVSSMNKYHLARFSIKADPEIAAASVAEEAIYMKFGKLQDDGRIVVDKEHVPEMRKELEPLLQKEVQLDVPRLPIEIVASLPDDALTVEEVATLVPVLD